jgi:hypothetical protein
MPKRDGVQLHLRIRNSPDTSVLGDAGLLTKGSMQRAGPLYRRLRQVVNRSGSIIEAHYSIARETHFVTRDESEFS